MKSYKLSDKLRKPIRRNNLLSTWPPITFVTLLFGALTFPTPIQGHHVIFENIGQMAGSLTYMHCKLTLNLSSIVLQHQLYYDALIHLRHEIERHPPGMHETRWYYQDRMKEWTQSIYNNQKKIVNMHINETRNINEQLLALKAILPQVDSDPSRRITREPKPEPRPLNMNLTFNQPASIPITFKHEFNFPSKGTGSGLADVRAPRFLGFLAPGLGVFGTFMGIFNKAQIDKLQIEMQDVRTKHNRLVEVVADQDEHLQQINVTMDGLLGILNILAVNDPAITTSRLSYVESQIKDRIQIAIHVIQQAQHRRLAIDFLSHVQLRQLYTRLQERAEESGSLLLTQQHSDLFQLECSYFFDGQDVHLLLHVPMVPKDSLLRLYRLHPFPLPLTKDHSLIPVADYNILALSSGFKRYSAELTHTDLMGCHVVNNVYLCERHGVLNQNLNNSCLGSLYQQDFEAVKKLCPLEIHTNGEIVHQLANNWFLAYSPEAQTVPIICHNGTASEKYLSKGITKFFVSPGCQAHLLQHLVMSDLSLKLDTDIIHFEWRWDDVSLQDLQADQILPQLQLMLDSGVHRPTYSDLQQLNVDIKRAPGWWAHIVNFVGNAVLLVAFIVTLSYISFRIYQHRQMFLQYVRPTPAQPTSPTYSRTRPPSPAYARTRPPSPTYQRQSQPEPPIYPGLS